MLPCLFMFFFFNDPATTQIYTLSLHDALPISPPGRGHPLSPDSILRPAPSSAPGGRAAPSPASSGSCRRDRKSTRLNSSHLGISYAVFCLKKKKKSSTNDHKSAINQTSCPN